VVGGIEATAGAATMLPIRSSARSSGTSPKPNVPVGPVTATARGAAEAAFRERDPIARARRQPPLRRPA
jgi:hypothetical protein